MANRRNFNLIDPTERTGKLGEALRTLRHKNRYTIREMAEKAGQSPSNCSRFENNIQACTDEVFKKLAEAIGESWESLLQTAGLMDKELEQPAKVVVGKHGVIMESPEAVKPAQDKVIPVVDQPIKLPNGLTPLQTWTMTINTLRMKGRHIAMLEALSRYGRYGEYKDGTFYYWIKPGTSCKAMMAYLNQPKNHEPLTQLLGCNAKRSIKFAAVEEPAQQPAPVSAPASTSKPLQQRFGPAAVQEPIQKEEPVKQAAVPVAQSKPMMAGAEKLLSAEERSWLVERLRDCLTKTIKKAAENGTLPDAKKYAMISHILEVLEK